MKELTNSHAYAECVIGGTGEVDSYHADGGAAYL